MAKNIEWAQHLGQYALRHCFQSTGILNIVNQDGKLIATQPRRGILRTKYGTQPVCHRYQHHVPGRMAKNVVDLLETIEIEKQNSATLFRPP